MDASNLTELNIAHWDEIFAAHPLWNGYPAEELVRFVARTFPDVKERRLSALEVGCGPGTNLWYLAREGFTIAGIDGSQNAIDSVRKRLCAEGLPTLLQSADLKVGNFAKLPWDDFADSSSVRCRA